jgi:hypothetical protein
VVLWEAATGRELRQLQGQAGQVREVAFGGDGRIIFSIINHWATSDGPNKTIRAWDTATGQELWKIEKHATRPGTLALSPNGKTLAAAGDGAVLLLDAATGRVLRTLLVPANGKLAQAWYKPAALAFSPDGRLLRAYGEDQELHEWDIHTGVHGQRHCEGIGKPTFAGAISPDGRLIALGGFTTYLVLVEVATGREIHRIITSKSQSLDRAVFGLAFSPESRTLAWSGPTDGVIHLVETTTGRERHRLAGHRGRALSLAFSPDGKSLISGGGDSTALVWDLTGQLDRDNAEPLSCWEALTGEDAARAYRAIRCLSSDSAHAVPFLAKKLQPVAVPDPARVARILADLDNPSFSAREQATRTLADLGEQVEPALRQALNKAPSLEVKRRIEKLLNQLPQLSGRRLQSLRAMEALEAIGTPAALRLLHQLAQGDPTDRVTQQAQAAAKRLERREVK